MIFGKSQKDLAEMLKEEHIKEKKAREKKTLRKYKKVETNPSKN